MRVTVLANQDIASNLALNLLHQMLPEHQLNVLLSAKVGNNKTPPSALRDLAFFEQTLFNSILFPALQGRGQNQAGQLKSFEELAETGMPIRQVSAINDQKGLDTLAISKPHLILSIRFGFILGPQAIAIPEFGVVNLHSGILPQYRGVMATFWAMLNKEQEIGTTLHYIQDAGIDSGEIISIQTVKTDFERSYLGNVLALYGAGIAAMVDAVEKIASGDQPKGKSQDLERGHYYSFPDQQALDAFHAKGLNLYSHDEIVQFAQGFFN